MSSIFCSFLRVENLGIIFTWQFSARKWQSTGVKVSELVGSVFMEHIFVTVSFCGDRVTELPSDIFVEKARQN